MKFENGDKVQILSNGRAYKGVHDGKIGEVTFNGVKRSKYNITVFIEKESNPSSIYGVWYIDAKYLKLVKKQNVGILEINQEFQKIEEIMTEDKPYGQIFKDVVNNNKKENKNMRTIGILDLWKKNCDIQLRKNRASDLQKVKEEDFLYKNLCKKTDEINRMFPDGESPFQKWIDCQWDDIMDSLDNRTIFKLTDIQNKYHDIGIHCSEQYNEVKTMLSACDTYEQEMDVLKTYKIVDENGVLVK